VSAAAPALVRLPVWRARFVMAGLVAAFFVLAARSLYLQAMQTQFLQEKGEARYSRVLEVPGTRGRILDRNGEALAISTPVQSVWAIPGDVDASAAVVRRLAALLDTDARELRRKLEDTSRDFVYLKRQIAPETAEQVARLGLEGLYQHREYRRYYPGGEVTAHLVGFTGVDEAGQEGAELAFESSLGGAPGSRRVIKDRRGRVVEDVESIRAAQDGRDLALSIDGKILSRAFAALMGAVAAHTAKAGARVVMDGRTGDVRAVANAPSSNPNNRARLSGAQLRNRAVTDVFEPGSTLKPFTVALALESGRVSPSTVVHIGSGGLRIANYTIQDRHPETVLSVAQVIQKSSNVGAARIALALQREDLWSLFDRAGFGTAPQTGFPGEAAGRLRAAQTWRPIEQATMAYGHGISVSLLQLARAYTMFARDGELVPATLRKSDAMAAGTRVISAQTARQIRAMLELAVQPGGTAPRARIMGWRVAGKTGTAHKQENGGYAADKYIASFVGLAPASDPRLVVAVMIDEPANGQYFGGLVAAPVFAEVTRGALRALGVPYDAPLEPVPLPGAGEEAREST
jgi:cell division protein FtsI (penicillin-binding protein 3)